MNYEKMLAQAKEQQKIVDEMTDYTNYLPIAFLKPGKHSGRIIADPNDDTFFTMRAHQVGKTWLKCLSTDSEKDILCKWVDENSKERWKVGSRVCTKVYFHLIETDAGDQYWKVGTTYLLIGGARFAKAVSDAIIPLLQADVVTWGKLFNPEIACDGCFTINHDAKSTSCIFNPIKAPAIPDGPWREPLKQVWLNDDVVPTQEEYENALTAAMANEGTIVQNANTPPTTPLNQNTQDSATPLGNQIPSTNEQVQTPQQSQVPQQSQQPPVTSPPPQQPSTNTAAGAKQVSFVGPNGNQHTALLPVNDENAQIAVASQQFSCWTMFNMAHNPCMSNECGVNSLCVRQKGGVS